MNKLSAFFLGNIISSTHWSQCFELSGSRLLVSCALTQLVCHAHVCMCALGAQNLYIESKERFIELYGEERGLFFVHVRLECDCTQIANTHCKHWLAVWWTHISNNDIKKEVNGWNTIAENGVEVLVVLLACSIFMQRNWLAPQLTHTYTRRSTE